MTENDHTSHAEPQVEPALRGLLEQPKGVLQKNLKTFVYLGAALLVIVAALFSSTGKKTPAQLQSKIRRLRLRRPRNRPPPRPLAQAVRHSLLAVQVGPAGNRSKVPC